MNDLILIVYLVDVLSSIKDILMMFIFISPFVVLFSVLFISEMEIFQNYKHLVIKCYKTLLVLFLIALSLTTLIPSERSLYIMAGLYAGDKVITSITQSEVAKQAEKTLIAKLKDLEREYTKENQPKQNP